jgi:hypothetical protein
MISISIAKPAPPKVFVISRETMLSDRQSDLVERFVHRYIRSERKRQLFMLAMMSRLGKGRPGDGAVALSIAYAAMEIGIASEQVTRFGIDTTVYNGGGSGSGTRGSRVGLLRRDEEGEE